MIPNDYENMDDLTRLSDKEKLEITQWEIEKIDRINDLLFNALKYHEEEEGCTGFIYASFLISSATD